MNRDETFSPWTESVKTNLVSYPNLSGNPIFILGIMQRSGTNFLQALLCLHPDCVPGPVIHEDFLAAHTDLLVQYATSVYGNYPSHWGIEKIMGPSNAALCQHLGDGLISFLNLQFTKKKEASHITPENHNGDHLPDFVPKRLVTKTPAVKNLQHFFTIFPQAHLLIIIRDGRAVIESGVKSFDWNYEAAMRSWANAAQTILRFDQDSRNANQRYLIVRYEDIHMNVEEELRKILSFLGLDVTRYDFDAAKKLPIKGSSDTRSQTKENVHWTPIDKTENFTPMQRWRHWRRARHERFNWLAGDYLVQFDYSKHSYPKYQKLWSLWNLVLDARWKVIWRLNRLIGKS